MGWDPLGLTLMEKEKNKILLYMKLVIFPRIFELGQI